MRISDWSSDVCSSDLSPPPIREERRMLAIGLRLLAVICLAIMFAAVKVAGQRGVHVVETLFYRQFLALPLILGWLWMGPGFTSEIGRVSCRERVCQYV